MAGLRKKGRKPNSSDRLRKAQLSFYPEPENYVRLRALSARTGVPQQVYLRHGLDFVLQAYDAAATRRRVAEVRQQRIVGRELLPTRLEFAALAHRSGSGRRSPRGR